MTDSRQDAIAALDAAYDEMQAQDAEYADARRAVQNAKPRPSDAIQRIRAIDAEQLILSNRIVENRNLYLQARAQSPDLVRLGEELKRARQGAEDDRNRIRKTTTEAGKAVEVLVKAADKAPDLQQKIEDALATVAALLE